MSPEKRRAILSMLLFGVLLWCSLPGDARPRIGPRLWRLSAYVAQGAAHELGALGIWCEHRYWKVVSP